MEVVFILAALIVGGYRACNYRTSIWLTAAIFHAYAWQYYLFSLIVNIMVGCSNKREK